MSSTNHDSDSAVEFTAYREKGDAAPVTWDKPLTPGDCPRRSVIPCNRLESSNWDLLAALMAYRRGCALEELRDCVRQMTGRKHIFFAPSARCAIAQVLALLPHPEVVMPALTCPVVKTAAEVAGKQIAYVDLADGSVNASSAEFAKAATPGRVLVPTHLFGIATDIEAICEMARARGCVTIEDAASAFGATYKGHMLGTFGDFGILSFERSKRLPAFRGAAIIVNNEQLLDLKHLAYGRVVQTTNCLPMRELVFSLAHNLAFQPWIYGRLTLPWLLRNHAQDSLQLFFQSPVSATRSVAYNREFHPYQATLVLRELRRIHSIREHVRQLVSIYLRACRGTKIQTFLTPECDEAGLLRFPVVFSGKLRKEIMRSAMQWGFRLEVNYERALPKQSEYLHYPNAFSAARNLISLPLYTALPLDRARMLATELANIAKESVPCPESIHAAAGVTASY